MPATSSAAGSRRRRGSRPTGIRRRLRCGACSRHARLVGGVVWVRPTPAPIGCEYSWPMWTPPHAHLGDPRTLVGERDVPVARCRSGWSAVARTRMTRPDSLRKVTSGWAPTTGCGSPLLGPLAARLAEGHDREADLGADRRGLGILVELDAGLGVGEGGDGEEHADDEERCASHVGVHRRAVSRFPLPWVKTPTLNLCLSVYSPLTRRRGTRTWPKKIFPTTAFPTSAHCSDEELKELIQQPHRGGAEGLLQAPHPARQDRHPARRAGQPPAQEARGGRVRDQRRRRRSS